MRSHIGRKLTAGGFIAQTAADILLGVLYLFDGPGLEGALDAGAGSSGALAALATALSLISGLGYLAATAGFLMVYVKERKTGELIVGFAMLLSFLSIFFSRDPSMIRSLAAWVYTAVMAFTSAKRRYSPWVTALMGLSLAVLIFGASLLDGAARLGASLSVQGLCSGLLMALCNGSCAIFALQRTIDKYPPV